MSARDPASPDSFDDQHRAAVEDLVARALAAHEREGRAGVDRLLEGHADLADPVRRRLTRLARMGLLEAGALGEELPERVGEYRIDALIGEGGMGVVYRAHDEALERTVALKVLRPELLLVPGARERVRREATAAAQLAHPNVAALHFFGEHEGLPYLAMELVEGRSLAQILDRLEPLDAGDPSAEALIPESDMGWTRACLRVARDVARALDHAHRRGVLHRDVKPSNVIIDGSGRARLVDFGLARIDGAEKLTRTGTRLGSLQYMAPEQLAATSDRIDGRADLFSLGATLYELLTRTSPFAAPTPEETMRRIREGQLVPPRRARPDLSRDVEAVVLKALATQPSHRYATAADLLEDLENLLALRPVHASALGPGGRLRLWLRRRPRLATGLTVALGAVLLAAVGFFVQQRRAGDRLEAQRLEARENAQAVRGLLTSLAAATHSRMDVFDTVESGALRALTDADVRPELLPIGADADPLVAARAHLLLGASAENEGDYATAQVHVDRALTALARAPAGEHPDLLLLTHALLGDMHDVLANRRAAQQEYRSALECFEQLEREGRTGPKDLGVIVGVLAHRAHIARSEGRLDDAFDDLRRAREIAVHAPDNPEVNISRAKLDFEETWMRMLTEEVGVAARAADRAGAALERFEASGRSSDSARLRYHRMLGMLAVMEGDQARALAELELARAFLPTTERAREVYFAAVEWLMFTDQVAQTAGWGGDLSDAAHECGRALDFALEHFPAFTMVREVALSVAARQCARWVELGEVERAQADIDLALSLIDAAPRLMDRAETYLAIGIAVGNLNRFDDAIEHFETALELAEGPEAAETSPPLERERFTANALARLGLTLSVAGRPERALVVLERADADLRELNERAPATNERRSLATVGQELANLAIDAGDFKLSAARLRRSLEWLDPVADTDAEPFLMTERAWQTFSLAAALANQVALDEFWELMPRAIELARGDANLAYECALLGTYCLRDDSDRRSGDVDLCLVALEAAAAAGFGEVDYLGADVEAWDALRADDRFERVVVAVRANAGAADLER